MRKISEFFEINIEMGYEQNYTPFVQATHHQIRAHFSIDTGEMIDVLKGEFDDFPYKPRSLVTGWITIHRSELMDNWNKLVKNPQSFLNWIRPLQ